MHATVLPLVRPIPSLVLAIDKEAVLLKGKQLLMLFHPYRLQDSLIGTEIQKTNKKQNVFWHHYCCLIWWNT